MPAMKYTALLLLFLLAYLLLVRPLRRRVFQSIASVTPALPKGQVQARQVGTGGAKPQTSAISAPEQKSAAALPAASTQALSPSSFEEDVEQELLREAEAAGAGSKKYEVLKKRVIEHANKDPEQVSQLVRAWIHE